MSMVDETPRYYIEDGNLYHNIPGETILSGEFNVEPDVKKEKLGEATPELINEIIIDKKASVYDYDNKKWITSELAIEVVDIRSLLLDAPKYRKLYSPCFGEMKLYDAYSMTFFDDAGCQHRFLDDGRICNHGEVMLFPKKDRTTWHAWQYHLFITGDYITNTITTETRKLVDDKLFVTLNSKGEKVNEYKLSDWKFATHKEIDMFNYEFEQYQKLNGFKPMFCVGQMITSKDGRGVWHARIKEINENSYYCDIDGGTATISFSAQNNYEVVNENKNN